MAGVIAAIPGERARPAAWWRLESGSAPVAAPRPRGPSQCWRPAPQAASARVRAPPWPARRRSPRRAPQFPRAPSREPRLPRRTRESLQANPCGSRSRCGRKAPRYQARSSAARDPAGYPGSLPRRATALPPRCRGSIAAPASPPPTPGLRETSRLHARLHLFGLFNRFDDLLEPAHGILDLHVLTLKAGELRRDEHRLRQEFFDLPRARHGQLVLVRKFLDSENRDDVLQVLVALQNRLHPARHRVVLRSHD